MWILYLNQPYYISRQKINHDLARNLTILLGIHLPDKYLILNVTFQRGLTTSSRSQIAIKHIFFKQNSKNQLILSKKGFAFLCGFIVSLTGSEGNSL